MEHTHNPKVVCSNPAPATKYNKAFGDFSKALFNAVFLIFPHYFSTRDYKCYLTSRWIIYG